MYGSSSGTGSPPPAGCTVTLPSVQQATRSPGRPMTRLMKSFSPGAPSPTALPTLAQHLLHRVRRLREDLLVLVRRERALAVEHDDLAAADVAEVVDELVDEHPVADREGLLHRARRDVERLDEERLDDQCQHEGDDDEHRQLAQEAVRTPRRCRSVRGGPAVGPGLRRESVVVAVAVAGSRLLSADRSGGRGQLEQRGGPVGRRGGLQPGRAAGHHPSTGFVVRRGALAAQREGRGGLSSSFITQTLTAGRGRRCRPGS